MTVVAGSASTGGSASLTPARDVPGARRALLVAAVGLVALVALYVVFVRTAGGQRLDQLALDHLAARFSSRSAVASWLRTKSRMRG